MSQKRFSVDSSSPMGTYILLLGTVTFWGSAFVFSKVAESSVPPLVAAFLRFGIAALVGVIFIGVRRLKDRTYAVVPTGAWWDTVILGIIGVTLYNLFFFWGLSLSQASDGSMIIPTLSPAVTVILAAVFLKERFRRSQVFGLVITLIGAAIFFSAIAFLQTGTAHARLVGDGLFFAAAIFWAVNTLISKRTTSKINPLIATIYAMLFGSIVLCILALPQLLKIEWSQLSWKFWVDMLYLAVLPSVLANWFYYLGVSRIGPARAAVFMYFVPVTSLILAAIVLGESLTIGQFVGAILMIAGVYLINRRVKAAAPPSVKVGEPL